MNRRALLAAWPLAALLGALLAWAALAHRARTAPAPAVARTVQVPGPAIADDVPGPAMLARDASAGMPKDEAAVLATVFLDQAGRSAAYPTPQAMSDATAAEVKCALGRLAYARWKPALVVPLERRWAALDAAGKLATKADLASSYRDVAAGLGAPR